jgi:hypothetical protein
MKSLVVLAGSLLLMASSYEHASLPAAPSVPPVIYTITGTVRDAEGRPLEGVTISIRVTTKGSPVWRTDAEGRYQIRLAASSYALIVSKPGFQHVLTTVRLDSDTIADFVLVTAAGP